MKRTIDTSFWTDDKVVDIFSPEDRYFFLYLMTNPHTTQLGIYAINKRYMAFETGYSLDTVKVLLERFDRKYDLIKYSEETGELAIKNYLRHSIVKGGLPIEEQLKREIAMVRDGNLCRYVHDELVQHNNLSTTVKNILPILDAYANANAYAYACTQGRTVERTHERTQKRFTPPTLDEVRAYCQERKNNVDPEHFIDYYTANGWKVGGRAAMKDWKAAVRNWEKREKPEKKVGANGIVIENKPKSDLDKELDEIWGL